MMFNKCSPLIRLNSAIMRRTLFLACEFGLYRMIVCRVSREITAGEDRRTPTLDRMLGGHICTQRFNHGMGNSVADEKSDRSMMISKTSLTLSST